MGLFGKKKEEKKESCCCGGNCNAETVKAAEESKANGASVKILGSGCAKCNQLEANTLEALKNLGMDMGIDHITEFGQIAAYGVMSTPALVVDGKVVAYGKVLKTDEVVKILQKVRG
ncbi:MAG: thioredoxin family protein [Bacilli bacterium]|nr:thioredoxin family protein [Bacilli bacterium]